MILRARGGRQGEGVVDYGYFDEAYFERGEERGTVYRDYLAGSRASRTYPEIAGACRGFAPERALELGCATGIIVKHLNDAGVEAYGIDVSEWAVRNREHPNVALSGAENLPFPDACFDLVYSVHALEHLPPHLAEAAFKEIRRVSAPGAVQFHTLPIIGEGPYVGERASVIKALRKDPTHNLLEDRAWWLEQFRRIGFVDLHANCLIRNEANPDLSLSQLLLVRPGEAGDRLDQVRRWNAGVIRAFSADLGRAEAGLREAAKGLHSHAQALRPLDLPGYWADVVTDVAFDLDDEMVLTATVILSAERPTTLRFCFRSAEGCESDMIRTYAPGATMHTFAKSDLLHRIGEAGPVSRVIFGGEGNGSVKVSLTGTVGGRLVFYL